RIREREAAVEAQGQVHTLRAGDAAVVVCADAAIGDIGQERRLNLQHEEARAAFKKTVLMAFAGLMKDGSASGALPTSQRSLLQVTPAQSHGYVRLLVGMAAQDLIGRIGDGDEAEISDAPTLKNLSVEFFAGTL